MKKIIDTASALEAFELASINHAEATEQGDYKKANKNYSVIMKAIAFLRGTNSLRQLVNLLNHSSLGVRLWASTYFLLVDETEAKKFLNEISEKESIHALTAQTVLKEWDEGNLKL